MKCRFRLFRPFHPKKSKRRNRSPPIIAPITEPFSDHWILLYMFLSILIKCGTRMNEWMMTWRSSSCKSFLSSFFITTKTEINLLGVSLGLLWKGAGKKREDTNLLHGNFHCVLLKNFLKVPKNSFNFLGVNTKEARLRRRKKKQATEWAAVGWSDGISLYTEKSRGALFFNK